MPVIFTKIAIGIFAFLIAELPPAVSQVITPEQIKTYSELFDGSTIRDIKYSNQTNPSQDICKEICLEAELSERAQKTDLSSDAELQQRIKIHEQIQIQQLWLQSEIGSPSTGTLLAFYGDNKENFATSAQVIFSHIFLLVPPDNKKSESAQSAKAQEIYKQLQESGSFESFALKYSDIESVKDDKGIVGPVELARINPVLRETLVKLKPGEISLPVRTQYGWEIVQLDSITTSIQLRFEEIRDDVQKLWFANQREKLQKTILEKLASEYPTKINQQELTSETYSPNAVLYTIGNDDFTMGETSQTVATLELHAETPSMQKRIESSLPQLILMEQVRRSAEDRGLLDSQKFKLLKGYIRNRVLAEAFFDNYSSKRTPTFKEVQESYAADKEEFRGPPYAKGTLYRWNIRELTTSTAFAKELYHQQVTLNSISELVKQVQTGNLTTVTLATKADDVKALDWFREGPMGYHHDMAWFKTEPGNFTVPYVVGTNAYVGYVEARRDPEQYSFEQVRDRVRVRLMSKWTKEEREALIDEIVKNCECN